MRRGTKDGPETETSWIRSMHEPGKEVKINGSTSNTEVFFYFVVTNAFLSLPQNIFESLILPTPKP